MICYPSTTNWGDRVWTGATPAELIRKSLSEALAWSTLQQLTGFRLSLCPILVRPGRTTCSVNSYTVGSGYFRPYVGADGMWRNGCSCNDPREILLPGPVGRIYFVKIGGVAVNPNAYRIDNINLLVRTDGLAWPAHQDMALPNNAPGTFTVEYIQGSPPDALDDLAAGILAQEFLNAMTRQKCRLPSNVKAITRQGVQYEVDSSMFTDGMTGIQEVDAIVARRNPYKLKTPPRIMSVEKLNRDRVQSIAAGTYVPTAPTGAVIGNLIPDPANPGYFILSGA